MPRALVEQMLVADDPAARLLWRTPGSPPGLVAGMAGLDALLGTTTTLRSPAELHAGGLFGGSAPLLGASAPQRALMNAELAAGADADAIVERHLAGHLVHELGH